MSSTERHPAGTSCLCAGGREEREGREGEADGFLTAASHSPASSQNLQHPSPCLCWVFPPAVPFVWNLLFPKLSMTRSLLFRLQLKSHLLREAPSGHPCHNHHRPLSHYLKYLLQSSCHRQQRSCLFVCLLPAFLSCPLPSRTGLLHLGTADVWGRITLCWERRASCVL